MGGEDLDDVKHDEIEELENAFENQQDDDSSLAMLPPDAKVPPKKFFLAAVKAKKLRKVDREILEFIYAGTSIERLIAMGYKVIDISKAVTKINELFEKWKAGTMDIKAPAELKEAEPIPIAEIIKMGGIKDEGANEDVGEEESEKEATAQEKKAEKDAQADMVNITSERQILPADEPPIEIPPRRTKKSEPAEKVDKTLLSATKGTTTFKEIDKLIADLLAPQIKRSTAFQDVMTRIGMIAAFSLLQLGLVERQTFVQLAEQVAENPEALYQYVKNGLDTLISLVDKEKLSLITDELMHLRAKTYALELELEDYKRWFEEAQLMLTYLLSLLNEKQKEDFATWLFVWTYLKEMKKGKAEVV
jgi:hypothetical protein